MNDTGDGENNERDENNDFKNKMKSLLIYG